MSSIAMTTAMLCSAAPDTPQTVQIANGILDVSISTKGAELQSARRDGVEYIWQGDPSLWADRSPLLFPICGNLYKGRYAFEGREHVMIGHGFARASLFSAERSPDGASATFTLESDDATRAQYPFDFALAVKFRLDGATLHVDATVRNTGTVTMPFAYGGHPGFNVPFDGDSAFEDWYLEFAPCTSPDAFEFGNGGLITGRAKYFPLAEGSRLPLRHELFNGTGLFLKNAGNEVTLASGTSPRAVTVRFPDMPYLGFWQAAGEDVRFLCIEPWRGLPSFDGVDDDFATRPHMIRLAPGASTTLRYSVEFKYRRDGI